MSKKSGEAASLALLFAVESTAAALWCGVVSLALLDRRAVRTLRPCAEQAGPVVTAIVPARNEAALISGWIADVVAQTDGIARILVADDSSEDETARIALAWAQRDERIGVLTCEAPPAGWIGKSWAAHCAAMEAKTEWLLFSDADMRMQPETVASALGYARQLNATALSLTATLECRSVLESIVMPVIAELIFTAHPICLIEDDRSATALMWGGFILVRRDAYLRIGGHAAVRSEIAEDRALAQRLKAFGYGVRLLNGSRMVRVRMYDSAAALWEGWRKNFYEGVQRRPAGALLFIAINAAMLVLPMPIVAALALTRLRRPLQRRERQLLAVTLVGSAGALAVRMLRDPLIGARLRSVVATPLAGVFVCAVMAASARRVQSGAGQTWKGRTIR